MLPYQDSTSYGVCSIAWFIHTELLNARNNKQNQANDIHGLLEFWVPGNSIGFIFEIDPNVSTSNR